MVSCISISYTLCTHEYRRRRRTMSGRRGNQYVRVRSSPVWENGKKVSKHDSWLYTIQIATADKFMYVFTFEAMFCSQKIRNAKFFLLPNNKNGLAQKGSQEELYVFVFPIPRSYSFVNRNNCMDGDSIAVWRGYIGKSGHSLTRFWERLSFPFPVFLLQLSSSPINAQMKSHTRLAVHAYNRPIQSSDRKNNILMGNKWLYPWV